MTEKRILQQKFKQLQVHYTLFKIVNDFRFTPPPPQINSNNEYIGIFLFFSQKPKKVTLKAKCLKCKNNCFFFFKINYKYYISLYMFMAVFFSHLIESYLPSLCYCRQYKSLFTRYQKHTAMYNWWPYIAAKDKVYIDGPCGSKSVAGTKMTW